MRKAPCYNETEIRVMQLQAKECQGLMATIGSSCMCSVAKSCSTFCSPMDCSLLGSSAYGIAQARILEWVAISFRFFLTQGSTDSLPVSHLEALPLEGSVQFSSVAQSCLTLCNPMNCSIPGLPVYHQLLEFT